MKEVKLVVDEKEMAVDTLQGNGWVWRNDKWIPPSEAEEERVIAARVQWLGLDLSPVTVSNDVDNGGVVHEVRTLAASWKDKKGVPQYRYASRCIHPSSLRDAFSPDKLRHYHDNAMRNEVTRYAVEQYYREE